MTTKKVKKSPPNDVVFIGVDYSYTSPAICVLGSDFKTSKFFYATYNPKMEGKSGKNCLGYILNPRLKDTERYAEIGEWGKKVVSKCLKAKNVKVAMEGYSFGSSRSLTFNIAENAGLLKFLLFKELNIIPHIIPPTTAKKHFSGSGRANKEDMRQALIDKEGVDIVEWLGMKRLNSPAHDIVDSYAIALTLKDKLNNGVS